MKTKLKKYLEDTGKLYYESDKLVIITDELKFAGPKRVDKRITKPVRLEDIRTKARLDYWGAKK